ncbi:XRE family transcriptional regulator [Domibacillus aminovorans]|uniref:XRE family transcriptional regulator n=1 Tax=Domibacillus aminovorans TaxID=29332 RepID=A0A177KMR3_9BACI|nr:helix-turn-helix transcriptional regulator [Domibacillus aminovorans]OAH53861.1 XRE family transcriptional regulator [Domibacillus aminovorans]
MERKWLKDMRDKRGMTQDDVSEQAGISRSFYTHLEKGNKNPSVKVAKSIAKILAFDWTLFFTNECSLKELNKEVS